MFCTKCGAKASEGDKFCQKCGAKLIDDTSAAQPVDIPAAEENIASHANDATKANSGLRTAKIVGRILWWGSLLLLLPFWHLPFDQAILGTVAAIGLILISLGPKRPFSQPNILGLAIGVILLVVAVVYFLAPGKSGDKYVQIVKNGTLYAYPQVTVGEAFDGFLGNPKWESGLSEDKERFVNVTGRIFYYGEEADLLVQFFVDEKNDEFQYNACEIDGVPQNELVYLALLETIYNGDSTSDVNPASKGLDSQGESNFLSDKIVIGETQSYESELGNFEVTLDYAAFTDKFENEWVGGYNYPDEGCVFLRAAITVKNIGTENGSFFGTWSTVIYDGTYKFESNTTVGGSFLEIAPLTAPIQGAIIFEIPTSVMESGKSLVLNIDTYGGDVLSFTIRPGDGVAISDGQNTPSEAIDGLCFKGIPVDQLLGASYDDLISIFGGPDTSYDGYEIIYGDVQMYFDSWSLPEPYLMQIYDYSFDDFTYNGHSFTDDEQEITEIMGREPDITSVDYGTYFMTYSLSHMGSTAYLNIGLPATEDSTKTAGISIDWWHPEAAEVGGYDYSTGDDYW